MSFDIPAAGGFGDGYLGDTTISSAQTVPFDWGYAAIHSMNGIQTSDADINLNDFHVRQSVLIVHSLCKSTSPSAAVISNLGKWEVRKIAGVDTANNAVEFDAAPDLDLTNFYVQMIPFLEYTNLTLVSGGSLTPRAFQFSSFNAGGILAIKVSGTLTLGGGYFNLNDKGIPTSLAAYRPATSQENNGTLDTNLYSACENSITKDRLLLNVGDGALFLIAKKIVVTSSNSRIGNTSTYGVQYCRGATDSTTAPASVTNVGGSTILIAANEIAGFKPQIIAKYRRSSSTAGKGLARAYIAVEDNDGGILPDEGLYALDVVKNNSRLLTLCNINSFGNGSNGSTSFSGSTQKCLNAYALVSAISDKTFTISRYYADVDELVNFAADKLVMVHQIRRSSSSDINDGKFILTRIAEISGSKLTLEDSFDTNLSSYYVQIVVIPEFTNFTLSGEYKYTPIWSNGAGGICAIACSGTCNLSNGVINVESKGTKNNVLNAMQSNYYMKRSLPLGQGNGSVFILAKNLTMNTSTRMGGNYDGALFGGQGAAGDKSHYPAGGGWKGANSSTTETVIKTGGWGGGGGTHPNSNYHYGGWHSNSAGLDEDAEDGTTRSGCQGAHILIVADTITGFNLSALSTGGAEGLYNNSYNCKPGGCGYGGGGKCTSSAQYGSAGGYRGGGAGADFARNIENKPWGGGGGAGACFVYANSVSNQNTTGLVTT